MLGESKKVINDCIKGKEYCWKISIDVLCKRAGNLLSFRETKESFPACCTWTLFMAPLVAFCAFYPFFRFCPVYSPVQYKHSASLSEFSPPVSTRMGFSQSSDSKEYDSLLLMFTTNDWNILTSTGLSLLLQPYIGSRFSLISSLLSLSVSLNSVF
jgi:hypothetical protein